MLLRIQQEVARAAKVDVEVQEDVLVLQHDDLRCEIWVDWLDLEGFPFCAEVKGASSPCLLYGKTMRDVYRGLKRASKEVPGLHALFNFGLNSCSKNQTR